MVNWYLLFWVLILAIGAFQFGYAMGELTLLRPSMDWIYDDQFIPVAVGASLANTMVPVGAVFSSIITGTLSYYGRRTCIYLANVFIIVGRLLWLFQHIVMLILGRLVVGFGVGIFSVIIPIFILEISPLYK